ncbi:MAG: hypothetical protein KBS93_10290 [Flavobacteriaceae bacterium]|nr:hypothetical protein [Candidatus Onthonaster equi]
MDNKIRIKSLRSRPRFKVYTKASKEELITLIQKHLQISSHTIGGYANKEFAMVRLRKEKDKYWAPQLQIRWEEDEDNPENIVVRGIIGPKPNIWTMFMFFYGLSGALIITLGSYAVSEYYVTGSSYWIWCIPFAILLALTTYISAKIGQNIAKEHLSILNNFVNDIFHDVEFYE